MADVFSPRKRSEVMSRIRSENTKPEMALRKAIHAMGYRYRLHDKKLPGKPDIVFTSKRVAIQVRGCFWHGHTCKDGRIPGSRKEYWVPKLEGNKQRDKKNDRLLRGAGWTVITVWECKLRNAKLLDRQVRRIASILSKADCG